MRLILIRHGQTTENAHGILISANNPALTPLGKRQARAVGLRLADTGCDVLYCGPLLRNLQTASVISEAIGTSCGLLPTLYEVGANPAAWSLPQIAVDFPWTAVPVDAPLHSTAFPESRQEAFARAGRILAWLTEKHASAPQTVAVVSHGTFTDLIVAHALGLVYADATRFSMGNGAFHFIEITPNRTKILALNDESHLAVDERS